MHRALTLFFLALWSGPGLASPPHVQGEYEVKGWAELAPGASYRVRGEFRDYSPAGFAGTDLAAGQYMFTESILGDVDAWVVTNIVAAGVVAVTMDVAYAESGTPRVGMVVGYAPVCALSSNAAGFPQQPGPEYVRVSENLMNGARNYALRRIGSGGNMDADTVRATNYVVRPSGEQVLTNGAVILPRGNALVRTEDDTISLGTPQIETNGVEEGMTMWLRVLPTSGKIALTSGEGVTLDCDCSFMLRTNDVMEMIFFGGKWREMKRIDN